MISADEAREIILKEIKPLPPVEVNLSEGLGYVLAEDIVSGIDIPPFDNSAMDGFALIAKDTAKATKARPVSLKVIENEPAGVVSSKTVASGAAIKIMTGAPMPAGANTVIPVEETETFGSQVQISRFLKAQENIRLKGEDVSQGETVLKAGEVLRPAEIGMLASLGKTEVKIIPPPAVAILSTGDEIVEIDKPLSLGQIRDSNSYSLAAQIKTCGAKPLKLGIARDSREETKAKITEGLQADLLVTTGGVSVGEYDFVKEVLKNLGGELKFWRVKQRPGMPLAFWILEGKPIFGLPGNPVASMVCFEEYVRPAILKMMGRKKLFRPRVEAILEEDVKKKPGKIHYLRVKLRRDGSNYYAQTTGPQGSGILKSMVLANGLAIIPEDKSLLKAGEKVKVRLIDMLEDH